MVNINPSEPPLQKGRNFYLLRVLCGKTIRVYLCSSMVAKSPPALFTKRELNDSSFGEGGTGEAPEQNIPLLFKEGSGVVNINPSEPPLEKGRPGKARSKNRFFIRVPFDLAQDRHLWLQNSAKVWYNCRAH